VTQAPNGSDVSVGAAIRVTFSRPVDRASVESQLVISPATAGRFFWEGQTLTFRPTHPLQPDTTYQVTLQAGLSDTAGRANTAAQSWSFRTRSPRLLLLTDDPQGGSTLWLAAADGSNQRELWHEPAGIRELAVAPDGSALLLVVPRAATQGEPDAPAADDAQSTQSIQNDQTTLLLLDLETETTRLLLDEPDASLSAPAWSPQGTLIAFERRSTLHSVPGQPRIWLAQPDGTSLGPIYSDERIGAAPVWSPDGQQLAYIDTTTLEVGIFDFSSTARTFPDSNGEAVSWSPTGTLLAYTSTTPDDSSPRLLLRQASLADVSVQPLTNAAFDAFQPAWSPAGEHIAFVRRAPSAIASTLWLLPATGGEPRALTAPGDYRDTRPRWSPDSQHIAFVRQGLEPGSNSTVWLVPVEAGTPGTPRQVHASASAVHWLP
jgi:Tol biopolymer transport system component